MASNAKQVVIQKEDAVFWMDKNGHWCNEHGRFEHPKIIAYFHAAIRKDENGYHVYQQRDGMEEKVYFNYEDTALFVVDVAEDPKADALVMLLNNKEKLPLDPAQLYEKEDQLYAETAGHRIKFRERPLITLSAYMTEENGRLVFTRNDRSTVIRKLEDDQIL